MEGEKEKGERRSERRREEESIPTPSRPHLPPPPLFFPLGEGEVSVLRWW